MILRQSQFVAPVPLLVATELGLLDRIGLEVTRAAGSAEQLRGLLDGELDLAVTAIDNLFEWTRAGADVRLVAQVERTTPLGLYARAEAHSLADLAAGRFAVDAFANGFALVARHLLKGIEVDYVEVGGVRERLESLLGGESDATLLGPPFDAAAERAGLRPLATVNELLPGFPGQGLVVRAELACSGELVGYLGALHRAVEASAMITDEDGIALLERHGFSSAVAAWESRPRTLEVEPAGLAVLTDIRADLGLLPSHVALAALHDPAPLRRAVT